ncbi:Nn.00g015140.m01.CDS01 [Neocucurbitaria sp. VM-36]
MSSIINALTDLVKSVVELVWSFFTTAGDLVQKTVQFALKFVTECLDLVINFFKGLVDLAGGIVSFMLGNVLMLAVAAAAVFAFLQYQRSQGRPVTVGNKKLN